MCFYVFFWIWISYLLYFSMKCINLIKPLAQTGGLTIPGTYWYYENQKYTENLIELIIQGLINADS